MLNDGVASSRDEQDVEATRFSSPLLISQEPVAAASAKTKTLSSSSNAENIIKNSFQKHSARLRRDAESFSSQIGYRSGGGGSQ